MAPAANQMGHLVGTNLRRELAGKPRDTFTYFNKGDLATIGKHRAVAVLDRDHLARMTFGDRSLEREVLHLFDRQSELLLERMRASEPAAIATLAHTLKGSAVGIGATRVAGAAAEVDKFNLVPELRRDPLRLDVQACYVRA